MSAEMLGSRRKNTIGWAKVLTVGSCRDESMGSWTMESVVKEASGHLDRATRVESKYEPWQKGYHEVVVLQTDRLLTFRNC